MDNVNGTDKSLNMHISNDSNFQKNSSDISIFYNNVNKNVLIINNLYNLENF